MAFGPKSRQPPDLCREGQHTPLRPDDQDGRAGQNIAIGTDHIANALNPQVVVATILDSVDLD